MSTFDATAYRNLTARDREFNATVVATAMRAATDTELRDLYYGYRNVAGWRAADALWSAARRRSDVVLTADACADVARTLRVLAPYTAKAEVL